MTCVLADNDTTTIQCHVYNMYRRELGDVCILADNDTTTIQCHVCHVYRRELYDVCIRAEDNTTIQCHKCVLAARLEYFHSMLGSGWIEVLGDALMVYVVFDF